LTAVTIFWVVPAGSMLAVSQPASLIANEVNAILDRNATSELHRSKTTVRASGALIFLNSPAYGLWVASGAAAWAQGASPVSGYAIAANAGALGATADGAALAAVLGAVDGVVPAHAAKTIATVASNAASGDHLVDRIILGTPPLSPSPDRRASLSGASGRTPPRALRARGCPEA
jgi:hypothetical protein